MYLVPFFLSLLTFTIVSYDKKVAAAQADTYDQLWKRQNDPNRDITLCPLNAGRNISQLADLYNHMAYGALDSGYFHGATYPRTIVVGKFLQLLNPSGVSIGTANTLECVHSQKIFNVYTVALGLIDSREGSSLVDPTVLYGDGLVAPAYQKNITTYDPECRTYEPFPETIGSVKAIKQALRGASKYLARLSPDMKLDSQSNINTIGTQAHPAYRVLTLNTCDPPAADDTTCSSFTSQQLSDPAGILYGKDGWSGPKNTTIYEDAQTIVINIPVREGGSLVIPTDASIGFKNCKTIFNFYPVDANGNFVDKDTSFNVTYDGTSGALEGFVLIPGGKFYAATPVAGKLFADTIEDSASGLLDFSCGAYSGCFPVADYCSIVTTTTTTSTATKTEASTTTTTTKDLTTTATRSHTTDTLIVTVTGPTTTTTITTTSITTPHPTTTMTVTDPIFIPVDNNWDDERDGRWKKH
ncbi:hypothetical protein BJV82DRAFT_301799 [Fennellomyces sp. T-0311]|nr:hypothetical protein BJV82DRAFT_301799 [Fennellomyces sp. T-0311]